MTEVFFPNPVVFLTSLTLMSRFRGVSKGVGKCALNSSFEMPPSVAPQDKDGHGGAV